MAKNSKSAPAPAVETPAAVATKREAFSRRFHNPKVEGNLPVFRVQSFGIPHKDGYMTQIRQYPEGDHSRTAPILIKAKSTHFGEGAKDEAFAAAEALCDALLAKGYTQADKSASGKVIEGLDSIPDAE